MKFFERYAAYAPLFIRIALAAVFISHGAQKLFGGFGGYGLQETAKVFTILGFKPGLLMALFAGGAEFGGGLLLLAGFQTRIGGALIAVVMTVATLKIHIQHGFFMNWSGTPGIGHGVEYTLTLLLAALSLIFSGGGKVSVDDALRSKENPSAS